MRRAKHAAMLLAMAIGLGWSGPAADAQASREQVSPAPSVALARAPSTPSFDRGRAPVVDGQWRYVAARR